MLKPRFSAVAEAFSRVVGKGDDRGAALCVYHRGVPVVDIWAGTADVKTRRPWNENTIAPVTGATKELLAVAVLLLVQDGTLSLGTPVYVPNHVRLHRRRGCQRQAAGGTGVRRSPVTTDPERTG